MNTEHHGSDSACVSSGPSAVCATVIGAVRPPRAPLTKDQREEIRLLYAAGSASQRELAEAYGISQVTVRRVVRGESSAGRPSSRVPSLVSGLSDRDLGQLAARAPSPPAARSLEERQAIVMLYARGATAKQLAKRFGCSPSYVYGLAAHARHLARRRDAAE